MPTIFKEEGHAIQCKSQWVRLMDLVLLFLLCGNVFSLQYVNTILSMS